MRNFSRGRSLAFFLAAACVAPVHAGDLSFSGKLFADVSRLTTDEPAGPRSADTDADLKRLYLTGAYCFDPRWSSEVTLDVNWLRGERDPDLWVKHAFVQRKLGQSGYLRLGADDMPLLALTSKWYGYRYIDANGVGLQKIEDAADWGAHIGGALSPRVEYALSVVTGGGYKRPTHGASPDAEGYVGFHPSAQVLLAIGGYTGHRALDSGVDTAHTARRLDVLAAYAGERLRLGMRYAYASNWKTVRTGPDTRARQVSTWASYRFAPQWSVFGRFDRTRPDRLQTPSRKIDYGNAGVEWSPRKSLRVAAVAKRETLFDQGARGRRSTEFGFWTQVTF